MKKQKTPCTCHEHRDGASSELGGHAFTLETRDHDRLYDMQQWRAQCSCGSRTRWTLQSPNVPYHAWLAHVGRAAR